MISTIISNNKPFNIAIKLNSILIILFCLKVSSFCVAQQIIFADAGLEAASLSLQVKKELNFPDIKVQLGKNIAFQDFTVALTNFKSRANFVLSESEQAASRTIKLDNCDNFSDLKIQYGIDLPFPDVRIELRENGMADYLIYTENGLISAPELIACVLPLIREKAKK